MGNNCSSIKSRVYLVDGSRTPFGKFGGCLSDISPVNLAEHCSRSLLEKVSLKPDKFDHVIFSNVTPATTDTLYGARHLALKLAMPVSTPGFSVNRLCGSGIQAILDATRQIRLGESRCVLVSGSENMSMLPHLVYGSRFGTRYGELKTVDMLMDTLTDKLTDTPMAITAENLAEQKNISRMKADEFSLSSHQRAQKAYEMGFFKGEVSPIDTKKFTLERDEHLREDINLESLSKLKPSFKRDGVVTAGSASGIVDGAASVIVASEDFVSENNLNPLAEIIDGAVVGVDPSIMGIGPVPAIEQLLVKSNMNLDMIDLFEINEAFSAQALACQLDLKISSERLNIWGGAVAIGHPLGATGVRISLTLARQLKLNKLNFGVASACIGGGQGISILLKSV